LIEKVDKRLRLEDEIRQRLKRVCSNLTAEDFQILVEQIADNSLRSDARIGLFRLKPAAL
jgi:hypothetical protein